MLNQTLDKEFNKAYQKISDLTENIAPDIMLKFYSLYKQATLGDFSNYSSTQDIRDAFKSNAWAQLIGLESNKAKEEYIKLAKQIL